MKTWLIARASVPLDAGKRTQTAESLCHHCIVQRRAVLLAEQQILAVSRTPSVCFATNAINTSLKHALIGTMRVLKNFVSLMWSRER